MDSFLILATIIYLNPGYGLYQTLVYNAVLPGQQILRSPPTRDSHSALGRWPWLLACFTSVQPSTIQAGYWPRHKIKCVGLPCKNYRFYRPIAEDSRHTQYLLSVHSGLHWSDHLSMRPEWKNTTSVCSAEHSTNREHHSQIQYTKILFPKLYDMECVIRDANETEFHPSIMNRENNLVFNRLRKSLIHLLTRWESLSMTVKSNPFQSHKLHNGPLKGHTYPWYTAPSSHL